MLSRFAIVFALAACGVAGAQEILFSTFGPGESFSGAPGPSLGAGEFWNLSGNNGAIAAVAFTPSITLPFSHADFALGYSTVPDRDLTGTPNIDVTLTSDGGGQPGNTIETIHVTNAFGGLTTNGVLTASSSLRPFLQQGVQYWLVLQPPDLLHTIFTWFLQPTPGPNNLSPGQYLSIVTGSNPGWGTVSTPSENPAFAVYGASQAATGPVVAANGIVSAATYTSPVSSGSWMAIFGTNLSNTSRGWKASDFAGTTLPVSLDGVSVLVNGVNASVSYVSPGQVNAQVPDFNPYQDTFTLQVVTPVGASVPITLPNSGSSPGLFTSTENGVTYAAAIHAGGTLISAASPAQPGEIVAVYGTGFGASNPAIASGALVISPEPLVNSAFVEATVGGVNAPVSYAGITGAGLDQINVLVPSVPPGNQVLSVTLGGVPVQSGIVIPIGGGL